MTQCVLSGSASPALGCDELLAIQDYIGISRLGSCSGATWTWESLRLMFDLHLGRSCLKIDGVRLQLDMSSIRRHNLSLCLLCSSLKLEWAHDRETVTFEEAQDSSQSRNTFDVIIVRLPTRKRPGNIRGRTHLIQRSSDPTDARIIHGSCCWKRKHHAGKGRFGVWRIAER